MSRAILEAPMTPALRRHDRRDGQRDVDAPAILANADRFEWCTPSPARIRLRTSSSSRRARGNDQADGLPDRFSLGVPEDPLGRPIPGGNCPERSWLMMASSADATMLASRRWVMSLGSKDMCCRPRTRGAQSSEGYRAFGELEGDDSARPFIVAALPVCFPPGRPRAQVRSFPGKMTYIDSALLNLTEWCCRRFQLLTGRTKCGLPSSSRI